MNKRSSVINGFCRCFCLLLLMCFLLCACTGGAADEPEKEYVSVTLVDSVFFTADEPSQRVKYGGTASFTLKMRPGFSFVSCSYSDYEAAERDGECILTLRNVTRPSRVTVQADSVPEEADTNPVFSCSIRYVFNDGTQREKTEHYTLSYHIRPNTMNGNGIERDGYTLLCWNTRADGTGENVGLGSRVTAEKEGALTLYGKWAQWADPDDFAFRRKDGALVLVGYRGSGKDDMFVIPGKINGLTVESIASSFTTSMRCGSLSSSTLVLPSSILTVEDNAFLHSSFREIYFFDSLESFSSHAFPNAIAVFHINAATPPRLQKENYNVRFADNLDLIIANRDKKKMIFFSGCSMCYGLDSSMVDEAFAEEDYVVVNAGLNGEFNALFQLQCMLPYIGPGDILIHAPEQPNAYQFLANKMVDSRVYCMVEGNYDLLSLADFSYNAYMIEAYTSYAGFRKRTEACSYSDYNALFNNSGDYVGARPYDESTEMARDINYSEIWGFDFSLLTEENIAFLAGVYNLFRQKGAEVYFSWAPMNDRSTAHEDVRAAAVSFQEELKKLFLPYGIPVISEVTDYIYPGRYFFDSDYHLNDLGVIIRTERLIEDIRKAGTAS